MPYLGWNRGAGSGEQPLAASASLYERANNYIRLTFSGAISSLKEFQQGYSAGGGGVFHSRESRGAVWSAAPHRPGCGLALGDEIQLSLLIPIPPTGSS